VVLANPSQYNETKYVDDSESGLERSGINLLNLDRKYE